MRYRLYYKSLVFFLYREYLKVIFEERRYKLDFEGWRRFRLGKLNMVEEWDGMNKVREVGNFG